jgi:hypothetical protein
VAATLRGIAAVFLVWTLSAASALAQQGMNVVAERLGNPFAARWPNDVYPRNIWDMQVFDGALYLGAGNSSNAPPSRNAGPAPVMRYRDDRFEEAFVTDDEQVDVFRIIGDNLVVPGHDPRESWDWGNLYRLHAGEWEKIRAIPNAIHTFDIAGRAGVLFAVGGARNQSVSAWFSRNGYDWAPMELGLNRHLAPHSNPSGRFQARSSGRLFSLFEVGGALVASGLVPLAYGGAPEGQFMVGALFRIDEERLVPLGATILSGDQATERIGVNLFPTSSPETPAFSFAVRAVMRDATTYYLGVSAAHDMQWTPFGVFAASSLEAAHQVSTPAGAYIYDLKAHDGEVYALSNTRLADGEFEVAVLALDRGGLALRPWFAFQAPTFARSFEPFDGDWYFGLGSEVSLDLSARNLGFAAPPDRLSEATGEIWRVRGAGLVQATFGPAEAGERSAAAPP